MNRRSYIKGILGIGVLSATSFSIIKWLDINQAITPDQFNRKRLILAELVEMIIPETSSPGAKAAGVHDYILHVMTNCNAVRQQNKFFKGIEELEAYAVTNFDKPFLQCSMAQKVGTLSYFEKHTGYSINILNKINNKFLGEPFYAKLKGLTVEGYCVSQLGATQGLAYDYIPGKFEAIVPLKPHQKSWATK